MACIIDPPETKQLPFGVVDTGHRQGETLVHRDMGRHGFELSGFEPPFHRQPFSAFGQQGLGEPDEVAQRGESARDDLVERGVEGFDPNLLAAHVIEPEFHHRLTLEAHFLAVAVQQRDLKPRIQNGSGRLRPFSMS